MNRDSQESVSTDLFPLTLSPLEHYSLAQECPGYPMDFWLYLGISGVIERANFEQALSIVLKRHLLFQSLIEGEVRQRTRALQWLRAPGMMLFIDWAEEGTPYHPRWQTPIDLRREVGLRFLVRTTDSHTSLWIQVHHSCCDGRGMRRFLVDLFLACHLLNTGEIQKTIPSTF